MAAAAVAQTTADSARSIIESQLKQQEKSDGPEQPNPSATAKSHLHWPLHIGRQRDAVDDRKCPVARGF